jgi:hypothetical protein
VQIDIPFFGISICQLSDGPVRVAGIQRPLDVNPLVCNIDLNSKNQGNTAPGAAVAGQSVPDTDGSISI